MFRVLDEEREISKALIGPNGDMGFIHRIERIIKENSRGTLEKMFPGKKEDLKYFLRVLSERMSWACESVAQ